MFSHIFVQLFFDPAKNLSLIACRQQVALACSQYPTSRDIWLSLKELITVLLSLFCPTFFLAISAKLHSAASQRECKVEIYFCSANSHTHTSMFSQRMATKWNNAYCTSSCCQHCTLDFTTTMLSLLLLLAFMFLFFFRKSFFCR